MPSPERPVFDRARPHDYANGFRRYVIAQVTVLRAYARSAQADRDITGPSPPELHSLFSSYLLIEEVWRAVVRAAAQVKGKHLTHTVARSEQIMDEADRLVRACATPAMRIRRAHPGSS